ncbi:MAG: TcpQ domain-containing protein [Pseudomonadota bacterium]
MRRRIFLTCLLSAGVYAAPLSAETLVLNPNPHESISLHDSLPIDVPQPGDAYFDPPSATVETPIAQTPGVEVFEDDEIATIDISSMFSEVEDGAKGKDDQLMVRMTSDPYDEEQRVKVERSVEAVSAPEAIQPASGVQPEEITWSEPTPTSGPAWRALSGANIEQVLSAWAQDANVELVWQSDNAFAVLEPVSTQGDFETAVKMLLDQYQNDQVRPIGTLHVDSESGKRTLIIKALQDRS